MFVWKCVKDVLLFVQICLSRRELTDLGQGDLPLLVVHRGRIKRYTLRLIEVEVEGERGARDLLLLMLRGDRRHKRVHPILWTRHSTISNIIRSSIIRSSLNFNRVINIRRGMSITRGVRLSFTRGTSLSSLLNISMSSLLSTAVCRASSTGAVCRVSSAAVAVWAASWAVACRACYGGWGWGLSRGALWDVTFTELR